ncbi:protein SSUH2 homolog [Dysidea avara]|uniref:protein SSUH2 homolog n=1 Tax=Dysidea avara TaxID=196820 RepID=UPI0033193362
MNQEFATNLPNEEPSMEEPIDQQPSAPPLVNMDVVAGYDKMNAALPPPPVWQVTTPSSHQEGDAQPVVPAVSEEQARQALAQYVSSNCCYGSRAVRDLVFTNISPSAAIHYQLETFTEQRKAGWSSEPYNGLPIDGPENGPAPLPWDIVVSPPEMFKDNKYYREVPHTASVKTCHSCLGSRTKRCGKCNGKGDVLCGSCTNGYRTVYRDGGSHREKCHQCNGSGRKRCLTCNGTGTVSCPTCAGKGALKCYILLVVTWTNNVSDHIIERTALPGHLIKGVSGKIVFHAENRQVAPLVAFFDDGVNSASQRLVQQHINQFSDQRILQQRHFVRMVPVSEIAYSYNNNNYKFWVYGDENRVYEEDYPLKCCCGLCAIL